MARRLAVLVCLGIVACNQIVGVEDVRLRASGSRPKTTETPGPSDGTDSDPPPVTTSSSDAGADGGTGCNGSITCARTVFLTSQAFTGKLGGLAGADLLCHDAAQANPALKGRAFRAWLSDATKNAADRTTHGTQAFLRVDGSTFAQSYGDMTDGQVARTLNIDEHGNVLTAAGFALSVWTATSAEGVYNDSSCNNWTSEAVTDTGAFGDSQATDGDWTEEIGEPIALASCNSEKHLYCIEL